MACLNKKLHVCTVNYNNINTQSIFLQTPCGEGRVGCTQTLPCRVKRLFPIDPCTVNYNNIPSIFPQVGSEKGVMLADLTLLLQGREVVSNRPVTTKLKRSAYDINLTPKGGMQRLKATRPKLYLKDTKIYKEVHTHICQLKLHLRKNACSNKYSSDYY